MGASIDCDFIKIGDIDARDRYVTLWCMMALPQPIAEIVASYARSISLLLFIEWLIHLCERSRPRLGLVEWDIIAHIENLNVKANKIEISIWARGKGSQIILLSITSLWDYVCEGTNVAIDKWLSNNPSASPYLASHIRDNLTIWLDTTTTKN
jgi:hypothetical protein